MVEVQDASRLSCIQIDICRSDRAYKHNLLACPCYGNIEAAFAAVFVKWAEGHCHPSIRITPVTNAENNHVAFVALYVFQVLDEEAFKSIIFEEVFECCISLSPSLDLVLYCFHLRLTEGDHAYALLWILREMLENTVRHCLGFALVNPLTSAVVNAIRQVG